MVKRWLMLAMWLLSACAPASLKMRGVDPVQTHTVVAPMIRFACPVAGATQTTSWFNNLGYPIRVTHGYVWIGEDMGGRSDTPFWLSNVSHDVYAVTNWDHYAEPTGMNSNIRDFDARPGYFVVSPNDEVRLTESCTPSNGTPTNVAGFFVLYYVAGGTP